MGERGARSDRGEQDGGDAPRPVGVVANAAVRGVVENAIVGIERDIAGTEGRGCQNAVGREPGEDISIEDDGIVEAAEILDRVAVGGAARRRIEAKGITACAADEMVVAKAAVQLVIAVAALESID